MAKAGAATTRSRRLQDALVGGQVCLSLTLLIAAGILLQSSVRILKDPTGYETKQVLFLNYQFSDLLDYSDERKTAITHQLRERLEAMPAVASVSAGTAPTAPRLRTAAASTDEEEESAQSVVGFSYVEPNYFETLDIPILLGGTFEDRSTAASQAVVLSESAARAIWPEGNPVGRRLRLGPIEERRLQRDELVANGPARQVIAVVADKRALRLDSLHAREVYLQLPEDKLTGRPMLIRTRGDPTAVRDALEPLLSSVDPDLQATAATLEEMLQQTSSFVGSAMAAALSGFIGFCGLLLALMGIYGTVRYIVALRTREVGIRMAIGAQKRDVLGLVLRESMRPVFGGVAVGMALAGLGSYLIRRLVFGAPALDAAAVVAVSALFLAVASLASYAPARRAASIDPINALRHE